MNSLQIFDHPEYGDIRTILIDDEPWFVLKDVCTALEIKNATDVAKRLDEDERARFNLGRQGEATIINEYGLYNVILRSDKKEAKAFKRRITHEVLPTIRKHGAYLTPDKIEEALCNPDTIIRLAQQLKDEREQKEALAQQAQLDAPKVLFAEAVQASNTSILVGNLAKIMRQNGIDIGQNRLFAWLRKNGYLISRRGDSWNMPTQRSMEMGLFEIKETVILQDGEPTIRKTPKVTGKGQLYFIEKLRRESA